MFGGETFLGEQLVHHADFDFRDSLVEARNPGKRPLGQVDDSALNVGPPVGNSYRNGLAVFHISDYDSAAQRQRFVCCRQGMVVQRFAARRLPAVKFLRVIGRDACFLLTGWLGTAFVMWKSRAAMQLQDDHQGNGQDGTDAQARA